ncbi:Crp/Fnr family transcriptional regulator [Mesorhizobium sp. SB112]|uniref:Crp/Fnr family transcriptional regulator n=1 Tax=Mesorhizobium sp. SB112 TaxID=3151853 RepID=UPI003266DECD
MSTATIEYLLRSLQLRDKVSDEEKVELVRIISQTKIFEPGASIVQEDVTPTHSCLLTEGLAARCHYVVNGNRQISAVHIPGDFMDLHNFLLKRLDHGIVALTRCKVALVAHENLHAVTEKYPHLTRLLWLSTAIDAAIHRAWVVTMGRHSALSQLSHFICEMYARHEAIGLATNGKFDFAMSQAQLSDCLGLSLVHVNRNLQELRKLGLLVWRDQTIEIKNWEKLQELADFDPAYLSFMKVPR